MMNASGADSPVFQGDASANQAPLYLASASPRRAELLRAYGYSARIIEPPIPEPDQLSQGIPPSALAEALSYFKARSVAGMVKTGLVIGGDTVVALDGRCYGKAVDREDARRILRALAGTTQEVITGVTVLAQPGDRRLIQHEVTQVTMRPMSDEQIEAYLDTNLWQGKAGAYGIQDHGDAFVERVHGSFTNVVGLPMELLGRMLAEFGVAPGRAPSTAPAAAHGG
jgi:septum formation protein